MKVSLLSSAISRTVKICGKCQKIKLPTSFDFCANKSSDDGLYSVCNDCRKGKHGKIPFYRTCRTCLSFKPIFMFEGNRTTCRKCRTKLHSLTLDKEKAKLTHKRWRSRNQERHNKSSREWKRKNKQRHANYNKEWNDRNRDLVRAKDARRRAAKLKSTPAWVDHGKINKVYHQCELITRTTGVTHEVDHVIPLQGRLVCGLHVDYNLRVVTMKENRAKGNRHE